MMPTTSKIRCSSSLTSGGRDTDTHSNRCVARGGGFSSFKKEQQQKQKKSIGTFRSKSFSSDEGKLLIMNSTPNPIEEEEDMIEYCVLKSDEDLIHLSLTKRDVFRALVGIVGMVGMSTVVQGSAPPFARASNGESSLNKAADSEKDFKQLRKDVKALMEKDANLGTDFGTISVAFIRYVR
jgi:hypothetical protein